MVGRTGTETSSSEAVSMFFLCGVSHCNRTCDPSLFQFGLAGNSCVEAAGLVLHEIAVVRYQGKHLYGPSWGGEMELVTISSCWMQCRVTSVHFRQSFESSQTIK